jgi:hypothetical protein
MTSAQTFSPDALPSCNASKYNITSLDGIWDEPYARYQSDVSGVYVAVTLIANVIALSPCIYCCFKSRMKNRVEQSADETGPGMVVSGIEVSEQELVRPRADLPGVGNAGSASGNDGHTRGMQQRNHAPSAGVGKGVDVQSTDEEDLTSRRESRERAWMSDEDRLVIDGDLEEMYADAARYTREMMRAVSESNAALADGFLPAVASDGPGRQVTTQTRSGGNSAHGATAPPESEVVKYRPP